jgi:hypothetical protein
MTWFDTSVFSAPAPYSFGTAAPVQAYGPGFWNVDGSMVKSISFTERYVANFRVEFFDLFNHPNFNNPNTNLGTPTFGRISSTVDPSGQRRLQLAIKLNF